ncbi:MAG: hypothetical protein K2W96_27530, partial [Gemmataceae bacterium]|nr:hypothetical protein [Gemmataceae bacterium]
SAVTTSRGDEEELLRPRVAVPPPTGSRGASPASLTTGGAATTSSGATLGAPRPSGPTTSSIVPAGGPAGLSTYEQLQERLKARGVDWQALQQRGPESWHFHVAVADPKNPSFRFNYETRRPFPTALAAMEDVLRQMEAAPR